MQKFDLNGCLIILKKEQEARMSLTKTIKFLLLIITERHLTAVKIFIVALHKETVFFSKTKTTHPT